MKKKHKELKPTRIKWVDHRILGCQRTNHTVCKGELWECRRCRRKMCWEEGYADDLIDLCDDCWYDIKVLGHELAIGIVSTWKVDYEKT
jgi:hypothetical protein